MSDSEYSSSEEDYDQIYLSDLLEVGENVPAY